MNFSTGHARAWFHGVLKKDYLGWFTLCRENGSSVAGDWSYGANDGTIDFGVMIESGMYAEYNTMYPIDYIKTSKWDHTCNVQWTKLNALPMKYGEVYIHLQVNADYLYVYLYRYVIELWNPNPYDFVAIQNVSEFLRGHDVHYTANCAPCVKRAF